MNWLKKAFTISQPEEGVYYIITDPIQFYELRHSGVIPKDTSVSTSLPRSDFFTSGKVAASVRLLPSSVINNKLSEDARSQLILKIGELQTEGEIYQRFTNLDNEFKRNLEFFKSTSLSQKYFISHNKEPHLYRLSGTKDKVLLESFGPVEDIMEKLNTLRVQMTKDGQSKHGRAYELSDLRKMENLHTIISNPSLPLDATKIEWLLVTANMKPETGKEMNWLDCYLSLDHVAEDMHNRMNKFLSLQWVRNFASSK